MRISVITVCHNSGSTLERALQSVANQDYPDIEHIVIDGLSNDKTYLILDKFRQSITHLVSEKDNGIYDAMNKGLKLATGEIVCFLNSDDFYASHLVLSGVVDRMKRNKLDALLGDVGFFKSSDPSKIVRRYKSNRFTPEKLSWGFMPAHPALFLHKDVIRRVGLFKTNFKIAGDFEYIVRIFHRQNIKFDYEMKILVMMQIGGASTGSIMKKIELNREIFEACRLNGLKTNFFKIIIKYILKINELFYR